MATLSELITTLKGKMLPLAGGTLTGALTAPSVSITNDNAKVNGKNIVRSVNGTSAGTDGNVTLNTFITKTGDRGALAGYSTSAAGTTVDASANDSQYATSGTVTVKNGAKGQAWTKVVKMSAGTVTLESNWAWVDGEAPELSFPCLLICHWNNDKGIAGVVKGAA